MFLLIFSKFSLKLIKANLSYIFIYYFEILKIFL